MSAFIPRGDRQAGQHSAQPQQLLAGIISPPLSYTPAPSPAHHAGHSVCGGEEQASGWGTGYHSSNERGGSDVTQHKALVHYDAPCELRAAPCNGLELAQRHGRTWGRQIVANHRLHARTALHLAGAAAGAAVAAALHVRAAALAVRKRLPEGDSNVAGASDLCAGAGTCSLMCPRIV